MDRYCGGPRQPLRAAQVLHYLHPSTSRFSYRSFHFHSQFNLFHFHLSLRFFTFTFIPYCGGPRQPLRAAQVLYHIHPPISFFSLNLFHFHFSLDLFTFTCLQYFGGPCQPLRAAAVLHHIHATISLCFTQFSSLSLLPLSLSPLTFFLHLHFHFFNFTFLKFHPCRSQQTALWELISTEVAFIRTLKVIQEVSSNMMMIIL